MTPVTPRRALVASLTAYGAVVPLSVSYAAAAWAAALLSLAAVLWTERRRPSLTMSPVAWLMLAYLAVGAVTSAAGVDPALAMGRMKSDAHMVFVFFLFLTALKEEPAPQAVFGLAAGAVVAALIGIEQTVESMLRPGDLRIARGTTHHITYGELMFFALTGSLAFLAFAAQDPKAGWKRRALPAAVAALAALALVFSQARGAWLGFAAALATLVALNRRTWAWAAGGLAALAAVLAAFPALADTMSERFLSIFDAQYESNAVRLDLWRLALDTFRADPLTGIGPDNFRLAFKERFPEGLGGFKVLSQAHNLYLHQLAERGVVGLAALLALLGGMWWQSLQRWRARRDAWSLWMFALMNGFWVINLTQNSLQTALVWMALIFLWTWTERQSEAAK